MKKILLLFFLISSAFAQTKKEVTLDDILKKGTLSARGVSGFHSLKDGKTYVSIETDPKTNLKYVAKNQYSDGKMASILFTETDLVYKGQSLPISTDFDDNEGQILIAQNEEQIYRHSSKANYFVYNLKSKKITEVSPKGKQLFATFSPDGSKIAFIRENNIYVKNLSSEKETQITIDGKFNNIINGGTDWVYEEEFAFTRAFFWSPDSKKIAYYKFDECEVKEYSMTMFENLYPSEYKFKYPKAGEKNSIVSIHIYNLDNASTLDVNIGKEKDQYIPRMKWTKDPNTVCILRMNRHQNKLEYLFANASTGNVKVLLTETNKHYIDINDDLTFLKNGKQFILTNESNGYNHAYLYDISGKLINQITKGNWEVTSLYGIDEKNKIIYYQSTERSPLRRDIYAINFDGKNKKRISTSDGTNQAMFSSDYSYYILNHSNSSSPNYITLNDANGKVVRVLQDNARAKQAKVDYNVSPTEFFQFKTSEGVELNGFIIKPSNFDASKKYPLFMYVYGGPGSQLVADRWSGSRDMWLNFIAQKGYIIACVDNRGTGFRGADFKKMTYKELGKYETIDQIEAAKWFGKQKYIDAKRIGIWGWSYGGYMSSLCITKGADIFSMAIAVAPVTTWRFYDSIYTERYLQTPQENPAGYDQNSPINFANNLKGKFLLIHGTGDDNVHFQNSVMLSEALIQANIPFEQAYYPNKSHSISGGNTSMHLYTKMTDFILKNL